MTKRSKRGKTKRTVPATPRTGARPLPGPASISTLIVNGWTLLFWVEFRERWNALRDAAQEARTSDPDGYVHHPVVKLFRTVHDLVFEEIPANPDAPHFRQGKTLGREHTHWRRAKFHRRFRLFFRFHSASRTIIFAGLNDENTLRKTGAPTDVYSVFHRMLTRGTPPGDWDELVAECEAVREES